MTETDLLFLPATRAAALIRRRKLSPVEYIDAVLAAVESRQPALNAFATITADRARDAAKRAEQAVMSGEPLGKLHGVPVTIKDLFATAGIRTAYGSAIHAQNTPETDDILVRRLTDAGAIVIGKTTTPEFGHKGLTDGPSFGITRNPWNLDRTTGGSSGGAAAAVASGLGPLALGSDGAGSIRIPAACCGLIGLKPTAGLLPYEQAVDAFANYAVAGPLTRTAGDAALMMSVLAGPAPIDPWSLAAPPVGRISPALASRDLSGLRAGYIPLMTNPLVSRDVERNTAETIAALEALGLEVETVPPGVDWIEEEARHVYMANIFVNYGQYVAEWGDRMDPVLLDFIEQGRRVTLTEFRRGQYARTGLYRAVQALFARYDILLSPTLARTALSADFSNIRDQVEVDGAPSGTTRQGWTSYVYPFNLTGHPAISIPSGWSADGLPTGLQIVGRWHADGDLLRLAAILEETRPWADRMPPVS
jgi:Asp-tRNA(Asn)/Glu-tRNA(Gln) amidotransferase A subunit family amidase